MKTLVLYRDDGSETVLPFKWEICSACDGHGKSSAYLGAFTWEQMHEEGQEFIEDYFAGNYDRACDSCGGSGKVKVPDFERMSPADAEEYKAQVRAERECDAEQRAEMRAMYGPDY